MVSFKTVALFSVCMTCPLMLVGVEVPYYYCIIVNISLSLVVQSLSCVRLFTTPLTAACQASLSFNISLSLLKSCLLSQWCHPTISFSVVCFSSCTQSFPASGSVPVSQFFALVDLQLQHQSFQRILRVDFLQDWLVWSPCCPRDSQESSQTTVWKHQFFGIQPSLLSNSHIYMWLLEKS